MPVLRCKEPRACGITGAMHSNLSTLLFCPTGRTQSGAHAYAFALAVAACLVVVPLLGSTSSRAQGIPSAADAPREGEEIRGNTGVVDINEVERGLYVGVDMGANYYLPIDGPGFVGMNEDWLSPGTRMDLRLGYDVLNNVQAELFVLANFNQGLLDADAVASGKLTGDLAHFVPGVAARFSFITTERVFVYGRAGVGWAFWFPNELAHDAPGSLHTDVALGIEYYTRLRHISVGLETAFQGLWFPFAFGFQVYPTIKYTF